MRKSCETGHGVSRKEIGDTTVSLLTAPGEERLDRQAIEIEWIKRVVARPERESTQRDGRIRRWAAIPEADGKYLRVVLLPDGETVHNALFDRGFRA
ncbi:MAG: hypothetical protein AMXMBFR31_20240 [Candidatus Desulfobacillus denitrificans]